MRHRFYAIFEKNLGGGGASPPSPPGRAMVNIFIATNRMTIHENCDNAVSGVSLIHEFDCMPNCDHRATLCYRVKVLAAFPNLYSCVSARRCHQLIQADLRGFKLDQAVSRLVVNNRKSLETLILPAGVGGDLKSRLRSLQKLERLSVAAADFTGMVELPESLKKLNIRGEIPPYIQIFST